MTPGLEWLKEGADLYWMPGNGDSMGTISAKDFEGATKLEGITEVSIAYPEDQDTDPAVSPNSSWSMDFELDPEASAEALDLLFPRCSGFISIRNPANDDPRPWVERAIASLRELIGPPLGHDPRDEPRFDRPKFKPVTTVRLVWDEGTPMVYATESRGGITTDACFGVQTAVAAGLVTQEWLDREMGR